MEHFLLKYWMLVDSGSDPLSYVVYLLRFKIHSHIGDPGYVWRVYKQNGKNT